MPTYREDVHLGRKVPLIDERDIADSAVIESKIADSAVTTDKIADSAVTTAKVADAAVTTPKIVDAAVTEAKIEDGAVSPSKLSSTVVSQVVQPLIDEVKATCADLQNQIESIEANGYAMSTVFGSSTIIGICQNTLTTAINRIWDKLEEITGQSLIGIDLTVNPTYYIGEDGAIITITAETVEDNALFDAVEILVDGVQIATGENTETLTCSVAITDTAEVTCNATILGVPYDETVTVTHYASVWLGAGSTYSDVMVNANLKSLNDDFRGAYDVTCTNGDYIILVLGESLATDFIRADMNGIEIPFDITTQTVDGKTYRVYKSQNTYQTGTYNIDING